MPVPQRDEDVLITEIMLQINKRVYEQGMITEEVYQLAREKIITMRGGEKVRQY